VPVAHEEGKMMKRTICSAAAAMALCMATGPATAEILAIMNYESKPADQLKSLKLSGDASRREGMAIIDVDPESPNFGRILSDIPIDPETVAHHIFYDRTMSKAYITGLQQPALQVLDLTQNPYRLSTIETPPCAMGEDVILDEANERWYLTCMGSGNVIVGDVATDEVVGEIKLPGTYPHGLAVNSDIDRILVTSTITPDLTGPDEFVSVVRASDLEPLAKIRMSDAESPSKVAPVEVFFVPGAEPATAIVTNMFGHTLEALVWDAETQDFDRETIFDFAANGAHVPLEIYFNDDANPDRMYVTTAMKPGHLHIFDISEGPTKPRLLKQITTNDGAHHVGFTPDFKYGFVQNSFINLPDMSDGSVSVVDLESGEVIASMDTLKNAGFNPNSLTLLPQWNHLAGH
jgi:DNA-binding beta-propeller fold protein YncE